MVSDSGDLLHCVYLYTFKSTSTFLSGLACTIISHHHYKNIPYFGLAFTSFLPYLSTAKRIFQIYALSSTFDSPAYQEITARTMLGLVTYRFDVSCKQWCKPKELNQMDPKVEA